MKFVQRNLLKAKKNRGYKGSFVAFSEYVFLAPLKKTGLQMFLINWQMEGTNSNYYRSVKFEEISPKKTGDIHV